MEIAVMGPDGREIVSTAPCFAQASSMVPDFCETPADSQEAGGYQFFKVYDDRELQYIVVVQGNTDQSLMVGQMSAFQISSLTAAFKEHYDRDSFIKNLLLDNLLLIDIYERAKKLHIQGNVQRVVMLIETDPAIRARKDIVALLQEMPGALSTDFVTAVDEQAVVLVREVSRDKKSTDLDAAAAAVLSYLDNIGIPGSRAAYGTAVGELKEISHSYKEARMALDVGKIFFEDKRVIAYNQLGIGRLIYQLPIPLCKMFIREIFGDISPDEFDAETLTTIDRFFDNSLNVSETSRQLFIHRNTLVYRLDKILRSIGLDLRVFDDAITFKIAMMVVKYMNYMEQDNG